MVTKGAGSFVRREGERKCARKELGWDALTLCPNGLTLVRPMLLFSHKKYHPLVLKLKWLEAIYKIVHYYNEYCISLYLQAEYGMLGLFNAFYAIANVEIPK